MIDFLFSRKKCIRIYRNGSVIDYICNNFIFKITMLVLKTTQMMKLLLITMIDFISWKKVFYSC